MDEKIFYLRSPINSQNDQFYAEEQKKNIVPAKRLCREVDKFSKLVAEALRMAGRSRLEIVKEKEKKINLFIRTYLI